MRNAENNGIDLLLKALAKRESTGSSSARTTDSNEAGEHLDADELSTFAEGVLPDATRALYTAHLADCSRCRRIVAQLAMASGVGVRPGAADEASKSGLWSYLASFLRPGVMRYAVPALSLVILAAIGLTWIWRPRQGGFVAQSDRAASLKQPAEAPSAQSGALEKEARESTAPSVQPTAEASRVGADQKDEQQPEAKEEQKPEPKNENAKTVSAEGAQQRIEAESKVATAPAVAPAVDANVPPPPKPSTDFVEESKREALAKARQAPAEPAGAVAQSEDDMGNRRDKDEAGAKKKTETRTNLESYSVAGRVTTGSAGAAQGTRTVAGRRFRQVGNGWVDTAYDSAAQLTHITRGSEQYRALIGDEPGLRTIAEQLAGEVIVVWKGRTYRIR